ncbi:MAG: tetratricopeptide repeat protein [Planctomycetes bacterium]|nr:tetratricopeptide repeat protein [Planctomycetota bacterium]
MDVTNHIAKAEEALRKKNFDYAESMLEQVLSLQPDHGAARKLWCATIRQKAEKKGGGGWLAKLGASPHKLSAAVSGMAKSAGGRVRALEKGLASDALNANAWLELGEALLAANLADSAVAVFSTLGEAEPKLAQPWKRAAAGHAMKGRADEALACLERALKADPKDAEADRMRKNLAADVTLKKGAYEKATSTRELVKDAAAQARFERETRIHKTEDDLVAEERDARAALQQNAKDGRARRRLAELVAKREEWSEAERILQEGLAQDDNASELKDRIGDLQLQAVDREIRKLEGRLAAEENPNFRDDLELLRGDKRKLEAAEFRRRVEERPTDLALWFALGRVLAEQGELDEAIAAFQRSIKDPKTRSDSLIRLAACFQKKGLLDLATKQLEVALQEATPAGERGKSILYNLGLVAEQAGRRSDAFQHFSRIYEVDIHYRDVAKKIDALRS